MSLGIPQQLPSMHKSVPNQLTVGRFGLAAVVKLTAVWISVIVTVLTGLPYIGRARRLIGDAE